MEPVYHIKRAESLSNEGGELMEHIYQCCMEGNPRFKKIYTTRNPEHIKTDIQFTPLPTTMTQFNMQGSIFNMHCGSLDKNYVIHKYADPTCCSLIQFTDSTLKTIHTILSFSFNETHHCIKVETFCCNGVGGGTLFNFLINSVKCGLSRCKKGQYPRAFMLNTIDESMGFYHKYGLQRIAKDEEGMDVLKREISEGDESPPHVALETAITDIDNVREIKAIAERIIEFHPKKAMARASAADDSSPGGSEDNIVYLRRKSRHRRKSDKHIKESQNRSQKQGRTRRRNSFGGKTRKLR